MNQEIIVQPGDVVTIRGVGAPAPQPTPSPTPAPTPSPAPGSLFWTDWRKSLAENFDRGVGSAVKLDYAGRSCIVIDQHATGWHGEAAVSLPPVRRIYAEGDFLFPADLRLEGSGGGRHLFRVRGAVGPNNQTKLDVEAAGNGGLQAFTQGDWARVGEPIDRNAFGVLPRERWVTLAFDLDLDAGVVRFWRDGQATGSFAFSAGPEKIGMLAAASNWDEPGRWYISRWQVWASKP